MSEPITIEFENGAPILRGPWPGYTAIDLELVERPPEHITVKGRFMTIQLSNAWAIYKLLELDKSGLYFNARLYDTDFRRASEEAAA